uniref:Uncharacterized protein n=1 Tax=Onchocerca volvulus TaxID=6282 RepID=A0A8R1Y654_ONCVO
MFSIFLLLMDLFRNKNSGLNTRMFEKTDATPYIFKKTSYLVRKIFVRKMIKDFIIWYIEGNIIFAMCV